MWPRWRCFSALMFLAVCCTTAVLPLGAQKPADTASSDELALTTAMRKLALQRAQWCLEHRQCAEGLRAIGAAGTDPQAARVKAALEAATPADESPLLPEKRKEWNAKEAALGLKLVAAALKHGSLARAYAAFAAAREHLDPARSLKALSEMLRAGRGDKDVALLSRILSAAEDIDTEGKERTFRRELRDEIALRDGVLLKSATHAMVAWVALPTTWKPGLKNVPVQVAVEGAGSNFLGALRHFRAQRGDRPVILVVPCTFSNTNALDATRYPDYDAAILAANEPRDGRRFRFDADGLRAILDLLHREYNTAERFSITGFSGGGMLTWWWLLHHPAELEHVLLACGNFQEPAPESAPAFTEPGPDIHLLIGEKDGFNEDVFGQKPGIIGQTDAGEAAARAFGLTRITRRVVPGAGHDSFAAEVWKLYDTPRR